MTVNKAQGQTLERLAAQCFAHGQLYVAASRVGHPDRLRFAVLPDEETGKFLVRNIVYREALTGGGGARAPDLNGRAGTHDDEYDSNPEDASDTETSDDGSSSEAARARRKTRQRRLWRGSEGGRTLGFRRFSEHQCASCVLIASGAGKSQTP